MVPLLETECVVDDRALAGICESRDKESEGRTMKDIDARRWCLQKNTERKATGNHLSNFPRNTCNDEVLQVVDGERSLVAAVGEGRRSWVGHVLGGLPSGGHGGGEWRGVGPGRVMLGWMADGCSELGEGAQHGGEGRHWRLEPAEGQRI